MKVTRNIDTGDEKQTIRTISTKPKEHFEGRWKSGRLYPLYSVVVNNGTTFISQNAKMKEEPYVIYDANKKEFKAPDGWLIKEMSADSRVTALGGGGEGGVTPEEVEEMIKDKVDKVDGKGLSTNDYDNTEKNKVASAYQKPNNGIPKSDLAKAVQDVLDDADGAYKKPVTGIPFADLADGVQDSLSNADEAKAGLAGKQDTISDLQTIRTGAAAGETAYQKPSGGVPKSDLASTVQTSLGKADTAIQPAEFNELKEEVGTIRNGAYEETWDGSSAPVVADIPAGVSVMYNGTSYTGTLAASASTVDKIYLVSDGNGNYDRYVTIENSGTYSWKKVGTTAIPLSDYATNTQVNRLEAKVDGKIEWNEGAHLSSFYTLQSGISLKNGGKYRLMAKTIGNSGTVFITLATAPNTDSGPLKVIIGSNSAGTWVETVLVATQDYSDLYLTTYGAFSSADIIFECLDENNLNGISIGLSHALRDSDLGLVVDSKNIADPSKIQDGKYIASSGGVATNADWSMIGVPVTPGKKYTFGGFKLGRTGYYAFYNGTTLVGSGVNFNDPDGVSSPVTVTVPTGVDTIYIDIKTASSPSNPYQYLMVNEGEALLPYTPFTQVVESISGHKLMGTSVTPADADNSIVADLPISDGTGIEEGYAYIDNTSHTVKVKIS